MWQSHLKKGRKVGAVKYGLKQDRSGDMCFSLNVREREREREREPRVESHVIDSVTLDGWYPQLYVTTPTSLSILYVSLSLSSTTQQHLIHQRVN